MKIPGLVTVRSSSSRLPSKCFLPFGKDCNVIEHIIRRAKHYNIDPIICTSTDSSDDLLEKTAIKEGVKFFRGSLTNKLQRWADCATHYNLKAFHTVDADDPFFDGNEIKRSYELLLSEKLDVVSPTEESSAGNASVGYSLTTKTVIRSLKGLSSETDTEMMWFYLDKISDLKKKILPSISKSNLKLRLTLDYQEDYWLLDSLRRILGNLATRDEIDTLFINNPDLYKLNWFRNSEWKKAQDSKKI
tara:strand:+ start:1828 stop:2565 length:738 start_codon:yes stop_codon:yes gene_type:complete